MKKEKPAKQRSKVQKSFKVKCLFFFFSLVRVIGHILPIIDKYWPKVVEAYRELF